MGYCKQAESVRETCSRDPANNYLDILLQVNWFGKTQETKHISKIVISTYDVSDARHRWAEVCSSLDHLVSSNQKESFCMNVQIVQLATSIALRSRLRLYLATPKWRRISSGSTKDHWSYKLMLDSCQNKLEQYWAMQKRKWAILLPQDELLRSTLPHFAYS